MSKQDNDYILSKINMIPINYDQYKRANEIEKIICQFLNLKHINCSLNNIKNIYDVDLNFPTDFIYADVKESRTLYSNAYANLGIQPENLITLTKEQIDRYEDVRRRTSKCVWIISILNYQNAFDLRFISTEDVEKINLININSGLYTNNGKIHINKDDTISLQEFINFLKIRRTI